MLKVFLKSFFLAVVLMSFSSCKVIFTGGLRANIERQKLDMEKIQYYNSKSINLKRVVSERETDVIEGKVTIMNGQMIEEIEIKKNTPGVLVKKLPNEVHIKFEPGEQEDNYLIFKKGADQIYYFEANSWTKKDLAQNEQGQTVLSSYKGRVQYHGHLYRTNSMINKPQLMIKKKSSRNTDYNKRTAKGVKVN